MTLGADGSIASVPTGDSTAAGRRSKSRKDLLVYTAGGVCVLLVLLAIFAPLLAPYSPTETNPLQANQGPNSAHWLGTDPLGRDLLSRLLYGARISLLGASLIVTFATVAGTALAIASVWYGGRFDRMMSRALGVMFAIPGLLVAVLAVAVFSPGLIAPVVALSIAYVPYLARTIRSVALSERNLPYIQACRLLGYSGLRICVRHLLPNISPLIVAQATISFGGALIDLAGVSFLGLGVQPPSSDWGLMISEGFTPMLSGHPSELLFAGFMVIVTVVSVNLLGERLAARSKGRS